MDASCSVTPKNGSGQTPSATPQGGATTKVPSFVTSAAASSSSTLVKISSSSTGGGAQPPQVPVIKQESAGAVTAGTISTSASAALSAADSVPGPLDHAETSPSQSTAGMQQTSSTTTTKLPPFSAMTVTPLFGDFFLRVWCNCLIRVRDLKGLGGLKMAIGLTSAPVAGFLLPEDGDFRELHELYTAYGVFEGFEEMEASVEEDEAMVPGAGTGDHHHQHPLTSAGGVKAGAGGGRGEPQFYRAHNGGGSSSGALKGHWSSSKGGGKSRGYVWAGGIMWSRGFFRWNVVKEVLVNRTS